LNFKINFFEDICVPSIDNQQFFPTQSVETSTHGIQSQQTCSNWYTIFPVDKCENIALAFKTTVQNLCFLNPNLNCNQPLPVGQRICVPSLVNTVQPQQSTNPPVSCPNFYTLFRTDTCENIASAFRTTVQYLCQLNPGLNCNALPYGQRIW
jgi:peptidoglycan endopeptidase LytE